MPSCSKTNTPIRIVSLPDHDGQIDPDWASRLASDSDVIVSTWPAGQARLDREALFAVAAELPPDRGVLFLRSGLTLPTHWLARLTCRATDELIGPRIPCGNYADAVNPLAGLDMNLTAEQIDGWLWLCARHQTSLIRDYPLDCVYLPLGCAAAGDPHTPAALLDSLYVLDPDRGISAGDASGSAGASATGHLRLGLQSLLPTLRQLGSAPAIGLDGQPVTLHISHHWGGGVARWIDDLWAADKSGHHLILASWGKTDGRVHGQQLRLYAAGSQQGLIQQWPMTPAIADSECSHAHYRDILNQVIERYSIGRVIISSLIGHSLDALSTGLPTAHVLHDFYPTWPLLDQDPLHWRDKSGLINLTRALSEHAQHLLFESQGYRHWLQLKKQWVEHVRRNQVHLIAPSREVLRRWQALTEDPLDQAEVIPHGFSGWPLLPPEIKFRARADGRLNLVVVGRLSRGKGIELLERSLQEITKLAHITLVGCGREGMRFFGRAGVDVILDYHRDSLPELLARLGPQAALFLSTVPETWNYTLSEVRSLGIAAIATRLGSFVERIEHASTGWLFDPQAAELVSLLENLKAQPEQLQLAAERTPNENDIAATLQRYWQQVPATPPVIAQVRQASPADAGRSWTASRLSDRSVEVSQLKQNLTELRTELEQRTRWAERYERLSKQRTSWARGLERDIEAERTVISKLSAELAELEKRRRILQVELIDSRARLAVSQDHLDQTRAELDASQQRGARLVSMLEQTRSDLQTILTSRSWRWTRPMRVCNRMLANARRRGVLNPLRWPRLTRRLLHSIRFHGVRQTLSLLQGFNPSVEARRVLPLIDSPKSEARYEALILSVPATPRVSIIIPVFNKLPYTVACLHSLVAEAGPVPFEIIVVDDCSTDATAEFLAECSGLTVVQNTCNSGFIASCNAGAKSARGEFLIFLNNDTTVTAGWLEALLDTFTDFPQSGIVGARLAYPDGRLQEAGGIIFNDASGWNYGRNESPDLPQYNFTSEADYVSGACLAIRRELFERMGGFDSHYAPAYYEDTDLCFRVREQGLKVYCQPACTIVHHEGVSSGTDESSGIKRYQTINREKFAERWKEPLTHQPPHRIQSDRADPVRMARFHRAQGRALVIDATTPMPDHDSGSVRFTALLELMVEQGWLVSFMPQNLAWEGRYSMALQQRGVEVLTAPAVTSLEAWLKQCGADLDLIIVSRHYVLDPVIKLLRKHSPNARIVFDTVDLHFLREQRQAELSGSESMLTAAGHTRRIELGLMRTADITLVVSPVEQQLLAGLVPEADVRVLSNIHSLQGCQQGWVERHDLMFVGGFQHPPNVDAAEWLIDEIFPRIRAELPEVKLHLIGSRMPEALRSKARDGVIMHGFVEHLEPYLNSCRLSLAPLRYGAGVKGKVNQAMAWGLPVVATACAAEGMFLVHGEDVLMADDGEQFAAEVVRAYTDQGLWLTLSEGGLANVDKYFSRAAAGRVIQDLLER